MKRFNSNKLPVMRKKKYSLKKTKKFLEKILLLELSTCR